MERTRRGWYERYEEERITLDWIKTNCRITVREMELLKLIRDRKLVKRDHLEIISPSYRFLGKNRTFILNKSVRKLFEKMCIDKVHEERELGKGNKPCIIALDRGGSLLLGESHKRRIAHRKNGDGIRRVLPINYRHINGINQIEVETILLFEKTNNDISVWCHEKPVELYYSQEKIILIPDVSVEFKINYKPFYAFIEYDTGSENHRYKTDFPIIRDKLIKYKKYKMSNIWNKEYPYFPALLFITEDDKRIPYFNKKCKELGLQGWGIYYENYIAFLERLTQLV